MYACTCMSCCVKSVPVPIKYFCDLIATPHVLHAAPLHAAPSQVAPVTKITIASCVKDTVVQIQDWPLMRHLVGFVGSTGGRRTCRMMCRLAHSYSCSRPTLCVCWSTGCCTPKLLQPTRQTSHQPSPATGLSLCCGGLGRQQERRCAPI
jgi:hypothetical protein